MRITSIGGGPGGLYAAILLKRMDPACEVVVYERNTPDDTFGFGVVFSAATLAELEDADAPSYDALMAACARWDPVDVCFRGERIRARGNRFAAISRKKLLNILQQRGRELGLSLRFQAEVGDPAELLDADLVLGADGINSATRARFAEHFEPRLTVEGGKFIWLGTTKPLDAFTFYFAANEHGRFQAHAYPYDERMSTFIVECDERAWRNAGLDRYEHAPLPPGESDLDSIAYCQELFAAELGSHKLVANNSKWLDWTTVSNRTWRYRNLVLLGDAAHTAHFSIGSGTKLALEDAISLVSALGRRGSLDEALAAYEAERRPVVERLQDAAAESMQWFARYQRRYTHFAAPQFAYSLLTRSTRVSYDNLKVRDPQLMAAFERWFAQRSGVGGSDTPLQVGVPPASTSLTLRHTRVENRMVLVPPPSLDAVDGLPSPDSSDQIVGLGRGGAGLVVVDLVAISPAARVTSGCRGLYTDAHQAAWSQVVGRVAGGGTRMGIQLVHAGPRGATRPRSQGVDRPLRDGAWPLVAASAVPYAPVSQVPAALDEAGMSAVVSDFAAAAQRADEAGFDLLEIHGGHGYLLASFISPLTNQRSDSYGGSIRQRMAFPLAVVQAARAAWPAHKPLSVCLTGSDLHPGGISEDDVVAAARMLAEAGVDLINVVAGQTTPRFLPSYERPAFLSPWSDLVRNRAQVPTCTSGNIPTPWVANNVLAAAKADLCVLGRPLAAEPSWLATGLADALDERAGKDE